MSILKILDEPFFEKCFGAKDPRVKEYFWIKWHPTPFVIVAVFLWYILKTGPEYMKNRKPLEIKPIITLYNAIQIVLNFLLFSRAVQYSLKMKFVCEPIDTSNSPEAIEITNILYYFYLLKIFDLCDSVFFLLRHKTSHLTFLHLYHHAGMVFVAWIAVSWYPGGQSLHPVTFNLFVHSVMYLYYLVSSYSDSVKTNLGLKRNITRLQLSHHIILCYCFIKALQTPDCAYPKEGIYVFVPGITILIALFVNFYIKSYMTTKKKRAVN